MLADTHDSLDLDFCKKQISSSSPQTMPPQNTAYGRLLKSGLFYTPNKCECHFLGVVGCINIMNDFCRIIFTGADLWMTHFSVDPELQDPVGFTADLE